MAVPLSSVTWEEHCRRRRARASAYRAVFGLHPEIEAAAASISGWRRLSREARLVGQDHKLHPVPRAELGEQVVYVRLDRGLGDDKLGGDLGVGQAPGDQGEHLALPPGGPRQ